GDRFSLALTSSGTVLSWGQNGTCCPGLAGVVEIAAGDRTGYALSTGGAPTGAVWVWGDGTSGQVGLGEGYFAAVPTPGITGVIRVGAGGLSGYAVKADGTLWAWGDDYYGELGDLAADSLPRYTPVRVVLDRTPVVVDGATSAFAVDSLGTLWGWGDNSAGQLANGTSENTGVPTPVRMPATMSPNPMVSVAVGPHHVLALRSDGSVWGWGLNTSGEVGDGTFADPSTPSLRRPIQTLFRMTESDPSTDDPDHDG